MPLSPKPLELGVVMDTTMKVNVQMVVEGGGLDISGVQSDEMVGQDKLPLAARTQGMCRSSWPTPLPPVEGIEADALLS